MSDPNLTPRQLEILVAVVAEMKPAEVDWEAIAPKANCKTGKYARDQFNMIRKQLAACANPNASAEGATPKPKPAAAKKTPASKRKKEDDGNGDEESPTKKTKAAPRKPKAKSATPAESKDTPPAGVDENAETKIKEEPNEAGAMMDELAGGL